jgi:acetoacetate decarboxylase
MTNSIAQVAYEANPSYAKTGLKGFTLPLSPSGSSSLFPPPPWEYSAELLVIDFTADRDALAKFLPEGLVPVPENTATMGFGVWCSSAPEDPRMLQDPARGQHEESYLLIHAMRGDQRVGYMAFAWVTTELSQIRGHVQGFPKKLGQIGLTRAVEIGKGGSQKAPGHRFAGHVTSMGRRLATGAVTLERREPEGFVPPAASLPHVYIRLTPSLSSAEPAVQEFSALALGHSEIGSVYSGPAELEFGVSEYEELADLGPIQAQRGYLYTYAMSIVSGESTPL